jgi:D-aminopeptidase
MRPLLADLPIHDFYYYKRGKYNAITDVEGVTVGHSTIISGSDVRTGVTVIHPMRQYFGEKIVAAGYVFNGNGETMGLMYALEEGRLTSPIFMTNTYAVGDVTNAVIDYYNGAIQLPIVGECWDGYLNDIDGRHVKKSHIVDAITNASAGPVEQGNVGGGTGMTAFGFKAGIGTSSRVVPLLGKDYTVGVMVNNNLGNEAGHHRYLRIGGVDIGKQYVEPKIEGEGTDTSSEQQSSTIIAIATDIPLMHHQLIRLSKRAVIGMGRVGAVSYTSSGEFVIAFSTANTVPKRGTKTIWPARVLEENLLDDVFEALIEAVEESFINSLLAAEDMTGRDGHTMKAIPITELIRNGVFPQKTLKMKD